MAGRSLEELLVQTRALSSTQIAVAKRDAETRSRRLAPTLIDLGMMDEARLAQLISETTHLPIVHPLPEERVAELARRVPRAIAREYDVVPIGLDPSHLTVAAVDPLDGNALDVLRIATGLTIRPVVARYSEVQRLLARHYAEEESEGTILPELDFEGDASPGSTTQVIRPRVPAFVAPTLDARVAAVERAIKDIEQRLAAIEAALGRLPR